jgi:CheY-like chemotaxis protein
MKPNMMGGARVLVLDDDPVLGELLGETLQMLGHVPTVCQGAEEALERLGGGVFDLIFSDFRMPGMSGNEFYQQVLERHPALARRMVFLTGDVSSDDTHFFFQATRIRYLMKPFRMGEVEETVQEMLTEPIAEVVVA